MITKIIKHQSRVSSKKYKLSYEVYDEDTSAEFGFIGLKHDGVVEFKILEEKYLDSSEVCLICEFMDRLNKINKGEELDTLRDEYYYGVEPRQTESTDKTS